MRKFFLTYTVVALGWAIASSASPLAQAMPIATPANLASAYPVQAASYVCHQGRHSRRCYGDNLPFEPFSFYRPEPYYAYGYYQLKHYPAWWWGWRQPWWW
jgi:hypothetical protein